MTASLQLTDPSRINPPAPQTIDLTLDLGAARNPAAFVIALALAYYFTPIVRKAAFFYKVLDIPDDKLKAHKEPTPYLGGVAIYMSFLFALAFTYDFKGQVVGILLPASIIVMLGLFDDLKVLSPKIKLLGQAVAVFVLIKAGISVQLTFLPPWANGLLTLFWMVGITNAVNLIDVSDGLAAGVASIAGMFLYIIALQRGADMIAMLTLALVGSALGFLAYNRPPARIYMGDTGSMFLGFMLGALAMIGKYTEGAPSRAFAAIAPVLVLGIPIFDTFYVMAVRKIRRIPILKGSPDHFAVRLRNNGVSAGRIALISYLAATVLGVAGWAVCQVELNFAVGIVVASGACALIIVFGLWRLGRGDAA